MTGRCAVDAARDAALLHPFLPRAELERALPAGTLFRTFAEVPRGGRALTGSNNSKEQVEDASSDEGAADSGGLRRRFP
jgi:hypothetical protein